MLSATQTKLYEFFVKNQAELAKKYNGKFVVLKNFDVVLVCETFGEAVRAAKDKGFNDADFIVQEVNKDPAVYTAVYLNKSFFRMV